MRLRELQQVLSGALPGIGGRDVSRHFPNGKAGGMVRQRFAIMELPASAGCSSSDIGETASRLLERPSFVVAGDSDHSGTAGGCPSLGDRACPVPHPGWGTSLRGSILRFRKPNR